MHSVTLRKAVAADISGVEALIARSARGLSTAEYRPAQIEGALRGAFGVDTQLFTDQTYFVAIDEAVKAALVGCGGWSYRATLFGGDARAGRDATRLDPHSQAARIRAFFVDPKYARRGIGSLILDRCEREAALHGFRAAELMATLPGVKFYAARGYVAGDLIRHDVGQDEMIEFVPMRKEWGS
jgi:GNAT superfamily N-acetyltransferase